MIGEIEFIKLTCHDSKIEVREFRKFIENKSIKN